jgi:hypothetical protein
MIYGNFKDAIKASVRRLVDAGVEVHPNNWQSMDVSQRKEALMKELLAVQFQVAMPDDLDEPTVIAQIQAELKPNLPWADKHFELERVSREPINPGVTWEIWPWANSANQFKQGGQFDHSYAERYWPKWAGYTPDGSLDAKYIFPEHPRHGIRDRVGDLDDIVARLHQDPTTRQAVLSVWHPEDQSPSGRRVPCSLIYQFVVRNGYLHVLYAIRSCDAYRHFRDDLYLTARLALWVLLELRKRDSSWDNCSLGLFTITIGSFHCFVNDIPQLRKWL